MKGIKFKLSETLDELRTTRNRIAVESKTRPATILDLAAGETKTVKLETLVSILDALNEIAREEGIKRVIVIDDIIEYIPAADR
ncbi:XRE family transcriptional regulator [Paenibacillus vini]|uniref:helix-turn-helix domain-containing protein n=1 Tax=Paenibacillus vini TaxID=1476024 RepID=UPI0025B6D211|nr:XRE family transcriptional regulator [Paenibacillus vini]MDN4069693.1 XRE family transcriptional regulator [Paenibacillus vini]